jgi:hypothetical protein
MARKTSLKESTRLKGQLRIDQQKALRRARKRKLADPNSVLRESEIVRLPKKKKKAKKKKRKVLDVTDLPTLFEKRRKQREAIFE